MAIVLEDFLINFMLACCEGEASTGVGAKGVAAALLGVAMLLNQRLEYVLEYVLGVISCRTEGCEEVCITTGWALAVTPGDERRSPRATVCAKGVSDEGTSDAHRASQEVARTCGFMTP